MNIDKCACGGSESEWNEFYCINNCELCAANPINNGKYVVQKKTTDEP